MSEDLQLNLYDEKEHKDLKFDNIETYKCPENGESYMVIGIAALGIKMSNIQTNDFIANSLTIQIENLLKCIEEYKNKKVLINIKLHNGSCGITPLLFIGPITEVQLKMIYKHQQIIQNIYLKHKDELKGLYFQIEKKDPTINIPFGVGALHLSNAIMQTFSSLTQPFRSSSLSF